MWIFLFGIIAASVSYVALGASYRHRENYYRLSHADEMYKDAGLETKISPSEMEKEDKADEAAAAAAMWLAIGAAVAFVAGVAIPLGRLTYLAVWGTL